uniref:Anaphase-promoting complex subunit 11 n=1 Tax=Attheya septentrionalis TaxID=420275 RepID=A0A7S2URR6_9STRA|mmetsp:Transcript_6745/g.12140  ORF Transcript_6745/g.12140 Transcript_6745/m.12140 type:complete len:453 (+) Transcript_6745:127-1485(+)
MEPSGLESVLCGVCQGDSRVGGPVATLHRSHLPQEPPVTYIIHVKCGRTTAAVGGPFELMNKTQVKKSFGSSRRVKDALEMVPVVNNVGHQSRCYYFRSEIEQILAGNNTTMVSSRGPSDMGGTMAAAAGAPVDTSVGMPVVSSSSSSSRSHKEKRLKRHRTCCPSAIQARIDRARTQRLYLIQVDTVHHEPSAEHYGGPWCKLAVLGSTGNVYRVTLSKLPSCDCPDFSSGRSPLCKHILFVSLKVVGLPPSHDYVYQSALLTSELHDMFQRLQARTSSFLRDSTNTANVVANAQVQEQYNATLNNGKGIGNEEEKKMATRKDLAENPDCPICFEVLSEREKLTFCGGACGTNFHSDCMRMWASQSLPQQHQVTCPACRQGWIDGSGSSGPVMPTSPKKTSKSPRSHTTDQDYTNLGNLQGSPQVRDTSTYHSRGGGDYYYGSSRKYRRYR